MIELIYDGDCPHLAAARVRLSVPGTLISFLPVGLCPACWPVYTGLLSSLGLGFLFQDSYLAPLTVAFLASTSSWISRRVATPSNMEG